MWLVDGREEEQTGQVGPVWLLGQPDPISRVGGMTANDGGFACFVLPLEGAAWWTSPSARLSRAGESACTR